MQLSAVLDHPDLPHFPHHPPPPPTSSSKKKSPSQLRRHERRRQEAASRAEETVTGVVDETAQKHVEQKTLDETQVAEKHLDSVKNLSSDHEDGNDQRIEPIPEASSFKCDKCDFLGVSEKGLKQHTRIKHKIPQVDGNTTESEDEGSIQNKVKSETIDEECFKMLGTSDKCFSCKNSFTSEEECYRHMFLSMSQCCQNTVLNLSKCGLEKDVKESGIQRTIMKVHGLLPQLL